MQKFVVIIESVDSICRDSTDTQYNWGEHERAPHWRVVREPCLSIYIYVCMFRTSYRKYISLQITETFCRNGKLQINCRHVYCKFDSFLMEPSSSQSSSRRTVQSTEEKLKRRRERDRARRHAETARQREQRLCKRKIERGVLHVQHKTERPGSRSPQTCHACS